MSASEPGALRPRRGGAQKNQINRTTLPIIAKTNTIGKIILKRNPIKENVRPKTTLKIVQAKPTTIKPIITNKNIIFESYNNLSINNKI